MLRSLVSREDDTELIELGVAHLGPGEALRVGDPDQELLGVVMGGTVEVDSAGRSIGRAGGRVSVFEGPGHSVYVPPGCDVVLTATGGGAELAVAGAPLDGAPAPDGPRIIGPGDQRVAEVGQGNWTRSVRTILGPEHEAGRLLAGETVNPPGNWSSYPPHKHDRHAPPEEVKLEEVYLFKVDPPGGFGVQLRYDAEAEETFVVRDGDVAAIRQGYHPVVAAPGYSLYYLWVMAGNGRQMIPRLDPSHAWVQTGG